MAALRRYRRPSRCRLHPAFHGPAAPDGQHTLVDVADSDASAAPPSPAERHIACSARHVEKLEILPRGDPIKQGRFPKPMNAQAHQIVHEVVAVRHAVEDLPNQPPSPRCRRAGSRNPWWRRVCRSSEVCLNRADECGLSHDRTSRQGFQPHARRIAAAGSIPYADPDRLEGRTRCPSCPKLKPFAGAGASPSRPEAGAG